MTKVVIIGAGKGGRALLEMFVGDPTVTILGIADLNPWAPGLELARRLNVPVATELGALVADPTVDLIIDVTGSPDVERAIQTLKPPTAEVMGGASATRSRSTPRSPASTRRPHTPWRITGRR